MGTKTTIDVFSLRRMAQSILNTWKNYAGDFVVCNHCEQTGETRVQHDSDCPVRLARKILREHKYKEILK